MKVSKLLLMLSVSLSMVVTGTAAPTNDGLYATLQTTMGDVCFKLYYTNVPRTVANFVSLAEGTRPWLDPRDSFVSSEPYYNGSIFHRVISNFMIQCGSPKKDGSDGPGYTFEDEFNPALRHNHPGVVSMANVGPDSNGGQIFITVAATPWLDDVHTVFGNVVAGMNVVSNIAAVQVSDPGVKDRPLVDITITNVFITRNGSNALNFAVTNQALPEVEALPISIANSSGIKVSTGTATSSYQYVYGSTNLRDWAEEVSDYWPEPDGDWILTASGEKKEFFHANRVVYTPNTNTLEDIIGHRIVATVGSDVFDMDIDAINSGTFSLNAGTVQSVSYWDQKEFPYHLKFRFQATGYVPFWFDLHYVTPTNGRCQSYYLDSYFGWQKIDTGTFTDEDLNPQEIAVIKRR